MIFFFKLVSEAEFSDSSVADYTRCSLHHVPSMPGTQFPIPHPKLPSSNPPFVS